jgi:hypothetical protein
MLPEPQSREVVQDFEPTGMSSHVPRMQYWLK